MRKDTEWFRFTVWTIVCLCAGIIIGMSITRLIYKL